MNQHQPGPWTAEWLESYIALKGRLASALNEMLEQRALDLAGTERLARNIIAQMNAIEPGRPCADKELQLDVLYRTAMLAQAAKAQKSRTGS